jgi:ribosomal protein L24E
MRWKDRGFRRRIRKRAGVAAAAAVITVATLSVPAWRTGARSHSTLASAINEAVLKPTKLPSFATSSVAIAPTPDNGGFWLASPDGAVTTYGNAQYFGSMAGHPLNQPIVGIAATPDGKGYWLVAADGGIFTFGDAGFYGSMGGHPLNKPIVGMAATPDGKGYWEVASDGGIFTFGDAGFYGSMGGHPLNKPIVGMAATPDGKGYWEVASDGGIFTFGDAPFEGSAVGTSISGSVMGMAPTPGGDGYWVVGDNNGALSFPSNAGGSYYSSSAPPTWNNYNLTPDNNVSVPFNESLTPNYTAAPASQGYSYLETQGNQLPIRWNPCQTINYEVNLTFAPPDGLSLLQQAFSDLASSTGINFNYIGTTSQFPSSQRSDFATGPGGSTIWAPVLVAWEPTGYTDFMPSGGVIGEGGATPAWNGQQWVYVTGQASITSSYALTQEQIVSLIHHELGHVLGLGHVADPSEVMNPVDNGNAPTAYQWGDLLGLAHLGRAEGCLSEPTP